MVFQNTNWVADGSKKSILEYLTGVEIDAHRNRKVSETSETNKVFLRALSKSNTRTKLFIHSYVEKKESKEINT